jgi:F-type H+-transporting ATPase subunit epsilon
MFKLQILSQEAVKFEGDVKSLIAPGEKGEFQILPHHAPLISQLKAGNLTYRDAANVSHTLKIEGGLFEFSLNKATVLLHV